MEFTAGFRLNMYVANAFNFLTTFSPIQCFALFVGICNKINTINENNFIVQYMLEHKSHQFDNKN